MFKTKFELMSYGDVFFTLISALPNSLEVFSKLLNYYCQEKVVTELINNS